ncbi:orotidine 5-phosphate decarboxylase [Acidiplasma aeolicum]|nr:orotidine 5-phosphate decarboxylase [Acidiplasma sp. MBA-1]KPV44723.1 orotidine 5-phosphate decarboxylase [Acidiplasma aeolicum]
MEDSKIIFALDVYDRDTGIELAKNLADQVFAIKVNWPIILENGIKIISELSKYSKIICDFKLADVENTDKLITEKVAQYGAWGIISHAFTGIKSLRAVVKSAGQMKVFSVVSMSQESYIDNVYDKLVDDSLKAGVFGLVAPANRPDRLKKIRDISGDIKIIAPGVGAQGGNIISAIMAGADYIIIGRSIYDSPDPIGAIKKFNDEATKL